MKTKITVLAIVLTIFSFNIKLNAQWVRKASNGKAASSIASDGTNIFAGISGWKYASTPEAKLGDIFVSTDNGYTWTESGFADSVESVSAILIDGNNIFAGTSKGVFLSANNGSTWVNKGLANTGVHALAISGTNIFAGTGGGVYLSTDYGNTWSMSGLISDPGAIVIIGNTILAATYDGIKKSTDNGATWVLTGLGNQQEQPNSFAIIGNNIFAGCYGGLAGVRLSTDNGSSWSGANDFTDNVTSLVSTGNNLFAGTQGVGIFLSSNNGTTWTKVSTGLPANSGINALVVSGGNIFACTSNNSSADTTGNGVWMRPLSEMGITTSVTDPTENDNLFIYPNPSNGKFVINSQITNGEISVYNIVGEKNYYSPISPNNSSIDLSTHPSGIYFVAVKSGENIYHQKIIKQ